MESELQKLARTGGGNDEEEHRKEGIEVYSKILHTGDFERWQKFCYMDKNSQEFKMGKLNALWIIQRFTEFGSEEWELNNFLIRKYMEMTGNGI